MFFIPKIVFLVAYAWVPLGTPGYPWTHRSIIFKIVILGVHRASFSDTTKSTQIQAALKKTSLLEI